METPSLMTDRPPVGDVLTRLLDEVERNAPPSPTVSTSVEQAAEPSAASTAPSASVGASPLSALLGGVAANPALLSALPTLLENLSPLLGGPAGGGSGKESTALRPTSRHSVDRHTALLCAIKPYLGSERQAAADTVIRLCRVWDALEKSGVSLTGLLSGLGGTSAVSAAPSDGKEVP